MDTSDRLIFVTEPLLTPDFAQYRMVAPLAERLRNNFSVTLASPSVGPEARRELESIGAEVVSAGVHFPILRSRHDEVPSYILSWGRDTLMGWNGSNLERALAGVRGLRVNVSMTSAIHSDIWYLKGRPLGTALPEIIPSLGGGLKVVAKLVQYPLAMMDEHHFARVSRRSKRVYTNSRYNALWFLDHGLEVHGVLPEFYYPSTFSPTTARPSRDFILAYLGKETDVAALRLLAGLGFPIRAFGAKSAGWVRAAFADLPKERFEILDWVSHDGLNRLYTNALFTAFPFTEEPFGLVPVESMACGTPVLTYRKQGPGETVLDGRTGWLVDSPSQFVVKAHEVCERGVPAAMRENCLRRAQEYHVDCAAERWRSIVRARLDGAPDPAFLGDILRGAPTSSGTGPSPSHDPAPSRRSTGSA